MKSPLSLLLVAVVMATLGATVAQADSEDSYRQYPERHHDHRSDGDKHGNRGNDDRDHHSDWRGHDPDRARWNDSRERHHDWRGSDPDRARWNDSRNQLSPRLTSG